MMIMAVILEMLMAEAVVMTMGMMMQVVLVVVVVAVSCPCFAVTPNSHILELEEGSLRPDECRVTEVMRTLYLSLFGIRVAGQVSSLQSLETVEYLKIEFYEPSGPFQKYIYMDRGQAKVFLLALEPHPTGRTRPYSGFPTPGAGVVGMLPAVEGPSEQWPAARPAPGETAAPWPCAEYFGTDSFLLLKRDQPLQSPQFTSKFHQLLDPDFTTHQPGPAWATGYPETEDPWLISHLAGSPTDSTLISLSLFL